MQLLTMMLSFSSSSHQRRPRRVVVHPWQHGHGECTGYVEQLLPAHPPQPSRRSTVPRFTSPCTARMYSVQVNLSRSKHINAPVYASPAHSLTDCTTIQTRPQKHHISPMSSLRTKQRQRKPMLRFKVCCCSTKDAPSISAYSKDLLRQSRKIQQREKHRKARDCST